MVGSLKKCRHAKDCPMTRLALFPGGGQTARVGYFHGHTCDALPYAWEGPRNDTKAVGNSGRGAALRVIPLFGFGALCGPECDELVRSACTPSDDLDPLMQTAWYNAADEVKKLVAADLAKRIAIANAQVAGGAAPAAPPLFTNPRLPKHLAMQDFMKNHGGKVCVTHTRVFLCHLLFLSVTRLIPLLLE